MIVIPELDPGAQYVDPKTGLLTIEGQKLVRALNAILDRVGGSDGSKGLALKRYTVAQIGELSPQEGRLFYCTNDAGGEVPSFADGSGVRRVTDRAVVST